MYGSGFTFLPSGAGVLVGRSFGQLDWKNGTTLPVSDIQNGDGFVLALDSAGIGTSIFSIAGSGIESLSNLEPTPDGGAVLLVNAPNGDTIANQATVKSNSLRSSFVIKLDSNGMLAWFEQLLVPNADMMSSGEFDALAVDPVSGEILVVGSVEGAATLQRTPTPLGGAVDLTGAGAVDPLFLRLSPTGDVVTTKVYSASDFARFTTIALAPDGTRYLGGVYENDFPDFLFTPAPGPSGGQDAMLLIMDSADMINAGFQFGASDRNDSFLSIVVDASGDVVGAIDTASNGMTTSADFKVDTASVPAATLTSTDDVVVASLTHDGTMANWLLPIVRPKPAGFVQPLLSLRGGFPLLSLPLDASGATTVGTSPITPTVPSSVLLELAPGTPSSPTITQAFFANDSASPVTYEPSICGDSIVGTFNGQLALGGQMPIMLSAENAVVWASLAPVSFTPFPGP